MSTENPSVTIMNICRSPFYLCYTNIVVETCFTVVIYWHFHQVELSYEKSLPVSSVLPQAVLCNCVCSFLSYFFTSFLSWSVHLILCLLKGILLLCNDCISVSLIWPTSLVALCNGNLLDRLKWKSIKPSQTSITGPVLCRKLVLKISGYINSSTT